MEDVYSSTVRAIISGTRRLNLLLYCTKPGPLVNRTWTPDWTVSMRPNFYYTARFEPLNWYGFKASENLACVVSFGKKLDTLTVRGIYIDAISMVQDVAVPYFRRNLLDHFKFLKKRRKYGNDRGAKLAVARSILVARYGAMSDHKLWSDGKSLLSTNATVRPSVHRELRF